MNEAKTTRRPFIAPVVSEPTDALDATRAFGGQLSVLGIIPGSQMQDGDGYDCGYDGVGLDGGDTGFCP